MKIAYLVTDPGIPVFGDKGASVHVRSITSALTGLGHEVRVLAVNLAGDNQKCGKIVYHQVGNQINVREQWRWLKKHVSGKEIVSEIIKMDIVGRATQDSLRILKQYPTDLIIERLSLFGSAGMVLSEKLGIPMIIEMNAPLTDESAAWRGLQLKKISRSIEERVLRKTTGIIVVSEELERRLLKMSIPKKRVMLLPNGVDSELFFPGSKDKFLEDKLGLAGKFVIGFSGSLKPWHGVDILIKASSELMRRAPDVSLLILGDGPEKNGLKELVKDLGISDRVKFSGRIPHSKIPDYTRLMDVAAAPYRVNGDFYFSPLKIVEYLACGIPLVASEAGEISRFIKDGDSGILVRGNDPDVLHQKLDTLYFDKSLRSIIASNGKNLIKGRTWRDNARKTVVFAERLMDQ